MCILFCLSSYYPAICCRFFSISKVTSSSHLSCDCVLPIYTCMTRQHTHTNPTPCSFFLLVDSSVIFILQYIQAIWFILLVCTPAAGCFCSYLSVNSCAMLRSSHSMSVCVCVCEKVTWLHTFKIQNLIYYPCGAAGTSTSRACSGAGGAGAASPGGPGGGGAPASTGAAAAAAASAGGGATSN